MRRQRFDKVTSWSRMSLSFAVAELSAVLLIAHPSPPPPPFPLAAHPAVADRGSSSLLFWLHVKTTGLVLLWEEVCVWGDGGLL